MKKAIWIVWSIVCMMSFGEIFAQHRYYYEIEEGEVYNPKDSPQLIQEKGKDEIIIPYTFSLRLGGGYSLSLLDFDFYGKEGIINGAKASVESFDVDWGFRYPAFAANWEIKMGMAEPIHNISIGFSMDYYIIPVKNFQFEATGSGGSVIIEEDDLTDVHVLSFYAFLEYRVPVEIGKSWLVPYARFGVGMNVNIHDNRDILKVENISFGLFVSLGLEYYLNQHVSLFLEPRWHYNSAHFTYKPIQNTKFEGDMDLSSLTFLIGINFYWGIGKSL